MEKLTKICVNKLVIFLIVIAICGWCFIKWGFLPQPMESPKAKEELTFDVGNLVEINNYKDYEKKKLAVIVPYRDYFDELSVFVPQLSKFLNAQKIPYHIFVANQVKNLRFNRAALINAGFLYTEQKFDYIAIHDVDLLPLDSKISYDIPTVGTTQHLVSYYLHPNRSTSPDYYGGILLVPNEVFRRVDGMSNSFWGWGGEDNEFKNNLKNHDIKLSREARTFELNETNSFIDIQSKLRQRDDERCLNQTDSIIRDENSGLKNSKFNISSVHELIVDGRHFTLINVDVFCNNTLTPWCKCHDDEVELDDKGRKKEENYDKDNDEKQNKTLVKLK